MKYMVEGFLGICFYGITFSAYEGRWLSREEIDQKAEKYTGELVREVRRVSEIIDIVHFANKIKEI